MIYEAADGGRAVASSLPVEPESRPSRVELLDEPAGSPCFSTTHHASLSITNSISGSQCSGATRNRRRAHDGLVLGEVARTCRVQSGSSTRRELVEVLVATVHGRDRPHLLVHLAEERLVLRQPLSLASISTAAAFSAGPQP